MKRRAMLHICALLVGGAWGMSTSVETQAAASEASPLSAPAGDAVAKLWASSLPDPAGRPQSLARFAGQVVVVNFWASWCGPCVEEMPSLAALYNQYRTKGVDFVGIGVDSAANVSKFLATVKVDYPIYVAGFGGADIARQFGNGPGALPFTVIVDRAGKIRYAHLGIVKPGELKRELDRL
jgi:thiol-disulfide isomerase/thioredoxin